VGFSPGGVYAPFARGHTRAFVSHGNTDNVLSYTNSRDGIVPAIKALGVPVKFAPFTGGHNIPLAIAREALSYALAVQ
jgi:phospholipase/carboxylesterase